VFSVLPIKLTDEFRAKPPSDNGATCCLHEGVHAKANERHRRGHDPRCHRDDSFKCIPRDGTDFEPDAAPEESFTGADGIAVRFQGAVSFLTLSYGARLILLTWRETDCSSARWRRAAG
jgi:hypothetical protein